MSIAFTMSARDLIKGAMWDRKVLALGVDPKAKEFAYGLTKLNQMLKTWAAKGLNLWSEEEATVVTTPGSALVTLSPRPIDVTEVRYVGSATYERPMTRWEQGEYATLPNKAQPGEPLIYSPKYAVDGMQLRIWPVPATAKTLAYSYSRVLNDVVELSDPVDVPQMWLETVQKCLAVRLDAFGGDPNHIAKLMAEAGDLETAMFDHDRPDSYFMGSDLYA